jgi:D-alanyl-lipoteichoic acid acyltransferase DltB (MBOAT superfamily)
VFKYYNFFLDTLDHVGIAPAFAPRIDLILPLGISFYTFQAMSYTIDVYRGHLSGERSFWRVLLCVTFFPHLVAGPIVRAADLLPQFEREHRFNWDNFTYGCQRILNGLVKKCVIADNLAATVDAVYAAPDRYSAAGLVLATYAYAIRIYCDFSGYSDIAIGTARLFGIVFTENFRMPYLSRSIQEFWRRWHISLSGWLRDYLYVPLGGNRDGTWRTYRNLMITMMLGGLWHGASFNFVIWGTLHGLWLSAGRLYNERFPRASPALPAHRVVTWVRSALQIIVVFNGVCLAWVFFISKDLPTAITVLTRIATLAAGGKAAALDWPRMIVIVASSGAYFAFAGLANRGRAWRWWLTGALGILLVVLFGTASHEFIYFVF